MKKIITIILASMMVFCFLSACGGNAAGNEEIISAALGDTIVVNGATLQIGSSLDYSMSKGDAWIKIPVVVRNEQNETITLNLDYEAFGPKGNELQHVGGSSRDINLLTNEKLKQGGVIDDATIKFVAKDAEEGEYEIDFLSDSGKTLATLRFEFSK